MVLEMQDERNIVILDDDAVSNMLSEILIKRSLPNAAVQCFEMIDDFYGFLRQDFHTPDAILIDINLAEKSGFEVAEHLINEISQKGRIFMFSSSINGRDRKRSSEMVGVSGFISKPLDEVKIESLIV